MKRPVNILQFTSIINRFDFIDTIVRFANPDKYKMLAASFTDKSNIQNPDYVKDNIPYYNLHVENNKVGFLKAIFKLYKVLRKERIEIIHTHHFYESLIGVLAAMMTFKTKVVVGRHYHEEFYLTTKGFKLKVYLWLEAFINWYAAAIVSPSTLINELLIKQGVNPRKIYFVTYGFDFESGRYREYSETETAAIRKEFGIQNQFLVGNFGRHHPIKGQKYLLEAFKRFLKEYPDALMIMVGHGPNHEELKAMAIALGIADQVIFTGWRKDGHRIMASVDVVVHPTRQEAFPQLMIEAMSLGKPLVICPVSGATDQVKHKETGYMVPFNNADEIYNAIKWLKERKEDRERIGLQAKQYVRDNLDIKKVIKNYENVYESILHP